MSVILPVSHAEMGPYVAAAALALFIHALTAAWSSDLDAGANTDALPHVSSAATSVLWKIILPGFSMAELKTPRTIVCFSVFTPVPTSFYARHVGILGQRYVITSYVYRWLHYVSLLFFCTTEFFCRLYGTIYK